ncbi:MAG: OmpA family protein [Pseudomonadota bacterium]|nr:OmpA family protein [Pseudomonadota bacterium]
MRQKRVKWMALMLLSAALLTACQSIPKLTGGLNPEQVAVVKQEGFVLTDEGWLLDFPDRILFEVNAYDIAPERQPHLAQLATRLRSINIQKLRIQGHTDNTGSAEHNRELSQNRAWAVTKIMQASGFDPQHIQTVGYGSDRPIASNDTPEGRANNRRVAVVIVP